MGTTWFSVHLKGVDSVRVRAAIDAATKECGGAAYVAPPRNGWVVVYPSMELLSTDAIAMLADDCGASDAVALSLYDSDVLCCWLIRGGELVDSFNSCPDYFGEANEQDMAAKGDASAYEGLLDAAGVRKLAKLFKVRMINGEAVGGELPDFEDERFEQIASVLGLAGANGFYDSIADGDDAVDLEALYHVDHRA